MNITYDLPPNFVRTIQAISIDSGMPESEILSQFLIVGLKLKEDFGIPSSSTEIGKEIIRELEEREAAYQSIREISEDIESTVRYVRAAVKVTSDAGL